VANRRANRLAHYWRAAGPREGDTVVAILEANEQVHAVMWARSNSGVSN
jgi:fatty-acyl-CoA synthase